MNDIQKKSVCDILESSGVELRKALDMHFRDLKLWEPTSNDYQLLQSIIATIQETIWTSEEPGFDSVKLKTNIYEALHGGRRTKTEGSMEIEAGERYRAISDFVFDWVKGILETLSHRSDDSFKLATTM